MTYYSNSLYSLSQEVNSYNNMLASKTKYILEQELLKWLETDEPLVLEMDLYFMSQGLNNYYVTVNKCTYMLETKDYRYDLQNKLQNFLQQHPNLGQAITLMANLSPSTIIIKR